MAFDLEKTHTIEITSYSVDDLAQRFGNPDVIYMDVEGYEALVLEGSSRTLQHRADWFIEVHSGHGLERLGAPCNLCWSPRTQFMSCMLGQRIIRPLFDSTRGTPTRGAASS